MKAHASSARAVALLSLLMGGAGASGHAESRPVSPGDARRYAPSAQSCPTFSWTGAANAIGYEIVVFEMLARGHSDDLGDLREDLGGEAVGGPTEEVLRERLPAGATSWTPPGDRCGWRAGGRFAWSVRAVRRDRRTAWSKPHLFSIPRAAPDPREPTVAEVRRALEILERAADLGLLRQLDLEEEPQAPGRATSGAVRTTTPPPTVGVAAIAVDAGDADYAIRATIDDPAGAAICANNPSGVDLVLGGPSPAALSEAGLIWNSASNVSFDFANQGSGAAIVTVDSAPVVTIDVLAETVPAVVVEALADEVCSSPFQFVRGFDSEGGLLCATPSACSDVDGDGFAPEGGLACGAVDCNDDDPFAFPGGLEVCDRIDNDCDAVVDGGLACSEQAEVEPNDDFTSATSWESDNVLVATVAPSGDEDWYRVELTEAVELTGTVVFGATDTCGPAGDIDSELELYENDGVTSIAFNDDAYGGTFCSRVGPVALAAGTYFVRVASSQQYAPDATFDYGLSLWVVP